MTKIFKKNIREKYKLPSEVKFCKRCVVSNQRPRIIFDDKGVCSACRFAEHKKNVINWTKRESELAKLCNKHRSEDGSYDVIVPIFFVLISLLLISTIPTYSFKKIVIPRNMTIFLLFSIVLFFGFLLVYTFKVLALSGLVYLFLIPISYLHYKKTNKVKNIITPKKENEDLEDIL